MQALVTADLEGWVDNARMWQITSKHPTDMTRLLQELVSRKLLTQDGQGRWTRYCLSSEADSVHKGLTHSVHKTIDSVHKVTHSVHKTIYSVHKEAHSVHIADLSDNELVELEKTAEPARKIRRLTNKEMESILLRLCHGRWLTRKELAELVDRNADGLRSRFLTQMVEHGLLCLRYPEKPNRVDQAYTKK